MKEYIRTSICNYPSLFKKPIDTLVHLFSVNGNGIEMSHNGYINENYRSKEAFEFGVPEPLRFIYPWTETEQFQPFRDYAGCREVGFKEAAQYFIDCIMITPDTVDGILEWKENIETVRSVLLDTPEITDPYTIDDMDKFLSDVANDTPTSKAPQDGTVVENINSVRKVWFFDVQWSDCPKSVESEVREIWSSHGLGNDYYIYRTDLDEELFENYPRVYFWLKHKGVAEGERVIVHWWW